MSCLYYICNTSIVFCISLTKALEDISFYSFFVKKSLYLLTYSYFINDIAFLKLFQNIFICKNPCLTRYIRSTTASIVCSNTYKPPKKHQFFVGYTKLLDQSIHFWLSESECIAMYCGKNWLYRQPCLLVFVWWFWSANLKNYKKINSFDDLIFLSQCKE